MSKPPGTRGKSEHYNAPQTYKKTNVWLKTFANVIKTHYICIRILTIVINTFLFSCLRFSSRDVGAVFLLHQAKKKDRTSRSSLSKKP